jgi:hypothetical protein
MERSPKAKHFFKKKNGFLKNTRKAEHNAQGFPLVLNLPGLDRCKKISARSPARFLLAFWGRVGFEKIRLSYEKRI